MKERISYNRTKDLDITAKQPLLDGESPKVAISNKFQPFNQNPGINLISSTTINMANRHSGAKYSKLENHDSPGHYVDNTANRFMNEQLSIQTHVLSQQDEQLDVISDTVGQLKTVSRQIGSELDEQTM